jgi:cytidylate kinase
MHKAHIITISGKPGSGKSSTADRVAEMLGYTRYSSGDFVRAVIRRRGISLAEFNEQARTDHTIDEEIDEELRKLRTEKDVVIDSRLGFYWIPESFKVYLDLDIDVATVRIFKDMVQNAKRGSVEHASSITDVQRIVQERLRNEQERFQSLYGVNPYSRRHFDLIVNTSRHTPQSVALTVFDSYKKWQQSETWRQEVSEIPLGFSLQ